MEKLKAWSSEADGSVEERVKHLFRGLDDLNIQWRAWSHKPLARVIDSAPLNDLFPEGVHTKNLFVEAEKGGKAYLLTCRASIRISWRELAICLGQKRFSFASEERLKQCLAVGFGAVTPLAVPHDRAQEVTVLLDKEVMDGRVVYIHPLVNHMTIAIGGDDLCRFLDYHHHHPQCVEL